VVDFDFSLIFQNQTTAGPGYFKNLKELVIFIKELVKD
jgi:hypothetical protein